MSATTELVCTVMMGSRLENDPSFMTSHEAGNQPWP